ncbi:tyrosine-protein phosphatase [Lactobacillus taiwanensis]|uniref:Protein tyrosine phosphatase n=1 Tax=Lactobacillus taiwanensis TaxID=508451 RepID=A0A256LC57_9LACO|nr:tyrosine-protein phosphatase [Lactobacillus taiwanensis]MCR1916133.1 tyrosine-protein phosphatase [Lactobacillus taiwanensis]OYR87388.1 protein tyrosine phosphatase [Lactobacillus taiwanensis]OYR89512.1 protein tyrosine phosphatase [Lactobacillus taiwanensis]OYR91008.1 protein tyrosine phosphatase [Lactobacillus taiwanensis]OYR94415.1 protein tyrosine phosphatase [Lactobacillus taiwanensis]
MYLNLLSIATAINSRELGGLIGFNNRKIKMHRLLRTGDLSKMSQEDKQFLKNYGVVKIIDLRSKSESVSRPDPQIDGIQNISIPLSSEEGTLGGESNLSQEAKLYNENPHAAFKMMCDHYRNHVIEAHDQETVRQVLKILSETDEGAVIFHCTEGKDRTGFVALFVLYILGVDLEVIRHDYLASNEILAEYRAARDKRFKEVGKNLTFRANMRVLSSASDSLFDTILLTIEKEYGNLETYLRDVLNVTPELETKLRELYLER